MKIAGNTVTEIVPFDSDRGGCLDRPQHRRNTHVRWWTRICHSTKNEVRVNVTPSETEKLLLAVAGMIARDRRERGVLLNYPETVALLSMWVIERAREGADVESLMADGRTVLSRDEVMPGVAEMLADVQVEATFPDGRKLVTIHHPIA
ncbi:urease, gamma subunit [Micrococcus terreus]|uniref:Urease subunit gamma n=2 Tax=Micrococcus terreus TaxID=574650 RepID=A0A1I7MT95_9MICC|nr:urease, gamma subunit [Micrococcus terreus]